MHSSVILSGAKNLALDFFAEKQEGDPALLSTNCGSAVLYCPHRSLVVTIFSD
jgi:hypothetical protein